MSADKPAANFPGATGYQVRMLIERRRFDQARELLGSALRADPDNVDLIFLSGALEYFADKNDPAMQLLQQVLEMKPAHASARHILHHVCREEKHYAKSEQLIISLIEDNPECAEYYADYSLLMVATWHLEKARELAAEGMRLDPDAEETISASAICTFVLEPNEASRRQLQELVRRFPDSRNSLIVLAAALEDQGRKKEALRILQELLSQDPSDEQVVDAVITLKVATHWSTIPLLPMQRYGWAASAAIFVAYVAVATFVLPTLPPLLASAFVAVFLLYVVYSWTYPKFLEWFFRR